MYFYKRNLPHWHPPNAEFFITFRLADSLPKSAIVKLKLLQESLKNSNVEAEKIQRAIFYKYEDLLDGAEYGPQWLSQNAFANIIADSIMYRNNKEYDLYCFCIMSNHVHLVFKMYELVEYDKAIFNQPTPLTKVLKELKRYTANEANKILGRRGQFWQHESYDRVIRNNKELERTIRYTLNNPVKAGLIKHWQDWEFSYCKTEFKSLFEYE
jgi:REP element-mobilizing transposase RayT